MSVVSARWNIDRTLTVRIARCYRRHGCGQHILRAHRRSIQYHYLRERLKQITLSPAVIVAARDTFVATPKLKMLLDTDGSVRVAQAIGRAFVSQSTSSSDDGGRYRQASTAVVFHPSSQPEKETTHG